VTPAESPSVRARAWFYLTSAIVLELFGIAWLKQSKVFTHLTPAVGGYLAYYAAFGMLGRVMRVMPASMTYTVWNGIGAAGVTVTSCLGRQQRCAGSAGRAHLWQAPTDGRQRRRRAIAVCVRPCIQAPR
jgi:small multidrug resistance pump